MLYVNNLFIKMLQSQASQTLPSVTELQLCPPSFMDVKGRSLRTRWEHLYGLDAYLEQGRKEFVAIPALNSALPEVTATGAYQLLYQSDRQFFCDSRGSVFVYAYGQTMKPQDPQRKTTPWRTANLAYLWKASSDNMTPIEPSWYRELYSHNIDELCHKMPPASFSVSPDGNYAAAQYTGAGRAELDLWNTETLTKKILWTSSWHRYDKLPKIAFHWQGKGFYWTAKQGGPLAYVSDDGTVTRAAEHAPYMFSLEDNVAVFFKDFRPSSEVTKEAWVDNLAAHVIFRKCRELPNHKLVFGRTLLAPKSWVYPHMPEFLVHRVGRRQYMVTGDLIQLWFADLSDKRWLGFGRMPINNTPLFGSSLYFATWKSLITGDSSESLNYLEKTPYLINKGGTIDYVKTSEAMTIENSNDFTVNKGFLRIDGEPMGFYLGSIAPSNMPGDVFMRAYPCSSNQVSLFPIDDEYHMKWPTGTIFPG